MKRDVLDDLIDICRSCLVVAKVELLKVVILLGQISSASKERYTHLSREKTQVTGKSVTRKLYG